MTEEELCKRVHAAIAESEIRAVVSAVKSGRRPTIGEILEHYLEDNREIPSPRRSMGRQKRPLPYRFAVEPWHLSAAERLILRMDGVRTLRAHSESC